MKIGDRLLCKYNHIYATFYINKWYEVEIMTMYQNPSGGEYVVVLLRGENGLGEYYTLENINGEHYIWHYFHTAKEVRRMKLEKIGKDK